MSSRIQRGLRTGKLELWALPLAAVLAVAGCSNDDPPGTGVVSGSAGGTGKGMSSVWTELAKGTLDTGGGVAVDPGGQGGPGGAVDVTTTGALSFGAVFQTAADVPATPADAMRISSLDADVTVTGSAVIDRALTFRGAGARRVTVTGGDLYVDGTVRAPDDSAGDRSLAFEAPDGTIYVTGAINAGATGAGAGGSVVMAAARIVVTGTLATAGGTGGGRAGDLSLVATGDVLLLGTIRARGGAISAPSGGAQGGAAATLAIDAGGNVWLGGVVDLRGGLVRAATAGGAVAGGAGGHVAIGATRKPTSVTFALDLSLDGGDGHAGAGPGGTLTAVAGGDFTLAGLVRSRGGSIAAGGVADGGLAGNFVLDIKTTTGNQIFMPGGTIDLDGGGSGGIGTAGGGGHLYARSFDGTVTMAGKLLARGGAARDPGGIGGLGGHVNIFSDANTDGIGGNLTVTPDGVIDVSGGAGTTGGSARNDGGDASVAIFPDKQEQIAILLNADGIHGTPEDGVIDNQGVLISRGGATDGAGGDIAFHGEGTGGLHDPLGGHLEMSGNGIGPTGQFASL